jgi:hypothetical protein
MDILGRHRSVPAHVYWLFRHYVPRLHTHATAVSRQQELLADRLAADVTGPGIAGQTLIAIEAAHALFEERYWPRIYERVADDPNPPAPYSQMGPEIWNAVDNRDELLKRLVAADTARSDTHPALRDRLRALQQAPRWPDPVGVTAADHFLGPHKKQVVAALDEEWRHTHGHAWAMRHDEIRRRRERLAQLAALPSPTPAETYERGVLTESDDDFTAALQFYLLAHQDGHARAGLAAGRILLDRDDASGIPLIDAAMEANADLIEDGCRTVVEFLENRGRRAEAYEYRLRLTRQMTNATTAQTERTTLSVTDRFGPCADPRIDPTALARRLAAEPGVLRAFLAAKELRYSSGTQTVLAVLATDGAVADLGERLKREGLLPTETMVAPLGRHDQGLESALGAMALIYQRS